MRERSSRLFLGPKFQNAKNYLQHEKGARLGVGEDDGVFDQASEAPALLRHFPLPIYSVKLETKPLEECQGQGPLSMLGMLHVI